MTGAPERYGITGTYVDRTHIASARRHIYQGAGHSKCGQLLVAETSDATIRLCGRCRTAVARAAREGARLRRLYG